MLTVLFSEKFKPFHPTVMDFQLKESSEGSLGFRSGFCENRVGQNILT